MSEKIAICLGLRNRTKHLLEHLIPSMVNIVGKENIVLSVRDHRSSDIKNIKVEIQKIWKGELIFSNCLELYTKSQAMNAAVGQAKCGWIFTCDPEISLPKDFISMYWNNVGINKTWFPMVFSLFVNRPKVVHQTNGRYRNFGFGMCGVQLEKYKEMGGMALSFKEYGGEDTHFFKCCTGTIIREKCPTMFHNWHPETIEYKNSGWNT